MGFERFVREAAKINIGDPVQRITGAVGKEKAFDKPGVLVAETVKEGLFLVPRNAAAIANWSLGKISKLLGATVKLGLQSAMLIPLPLPAGMNNLAAVQNKTRTSLESLRIKLGGVPRNEHQNFDRMQSTRNGAQFDTSGISTLAS